MEGIHYIHTYIKEILDVSFSDYKNVILTNMFHLFTFSIMHKENIKASINTLIFDIFVFNINCLYVIETKNEETYYLKQI